MHSLPILPSVDQRPGIDLPNGGDSCAKGRYSFISLGCPKNLVDSEQMLGLLHADGYRMVDQPDNCDFVVINTCGFIDSARKESMQTIDQMLDLKRKGKIKGVLVTGCLAERNREQLLEQRPEIDGLVGVFGRDEIVSLADSFMNGLQEQRSIFRPAPIRALADELRLPATPRHFAYLKISEGCDRLCTFCAIPKMRGKHASKPIESIIREAKALAERGVREIVIVAQDTTYYGIDLYGEPKLTELLLELDKIEGIDWIRLMYFYPMYIDDRLMKTIADAQRVLPYIDIPLQHYNDSMLKRMSRRVTSSQISDLVGRLRDSIPSLVLRTTMIVGFPGETDEQYQDLEDFVAVANFERLGVFTYSFEGDTPAAKLPDHLPQRIKNERQKQLMAVQQQAGYAWAQAQAGRQLDVIVDKILDPKENVAIGRSYADAPDVDAAVFLTGDAERALIPGEMYRSEVVSSKGYDLIAAALHPRSQV
jgi:ribosomal protein S12 methylthiotransferase